MAQTNANDRPVRCWQPDDSRVGFGSAFHRDGSTGVLRRSSHLGSRPVGLSSTRSLRGAWRWSQRGRFALASRTCQLLAARESGFDRVSSQVPRCHMRSRLARSDQCRSRETRLKAAVGGRCRSRRRRSSDIEIPHAVCLLSRRQQQPHRRC